MKLAVPYTPAFYAPLMLLHAGLAVELLPLSTRGDELLERAGEVAVIAEFRGDGLTLSAGYAIVSVDVIGGNQPRSLDLAAVRDVQQRLTNREIDDALGANARVSAAKQHQVLDEQPGADEQHERERDLRDDERVALQAAQRLLELQ